MPLRSCKVSPAPHTSGRVIALATDGTLLALGGVVLEPHSMFRPSSTPVRTNQARLVACHVGAALLQESGVGRDLGGWSADVRSNLQDTIRALSDLVREMASRPDGPRGETTGQFAILLDSALDGTPEAEDPVGDIAFIAASQLRRKAAELEGALASRSEGARAEARLADTLSSCLRHVLKATSTVEPILAATYGLQPRLSGDEERVRSLAIRRAYTQFRRSVADLAPDAAGIAAAAQALTALCADASARDFRPSDRVEIDALIARRRSASGDDVALGRWLGDVLAFASMLRAVDRREVLLTHDLAALPEVIEHVRSLVREGRPVLRGHLDRIRGIDDTVESMLEPGRSVDGERLVSELERVWAERRQTAGIR